MHKIGNITIIANFLLTNIYNFPLYLYHLFLVKESVVPLWLRKCDWLQIFYTIVTHLTLYDLIKYSTIVTLLINIHKYFIYSGPTPP